MENEEIKTKVAQYLKLYQELRSQTADDRVALTLLQEVNKDIRMAEIQAARENGNGNGKRNVHGEPATVRQKMFLKRLGVKPPVRLTKQEVSALIDEELEKESGQDSLPSIAENLTIPSYSEVCEPSAEWETDTYPMVIKKEEFWRVL